MRILATLLFLLNTASLNALTVLEFETQWAGTEEVKDVLRVYINGVGQGILYSNIVMEIEVGKGIYCPPRTIGLNADNYISILNRYLDDQVPKDDEIALHLLIALSEAFPCNTPEN